MCFVFDTRIKLLFEDCLMTLGITFLFTCNRTKPYSFEIKQNKFKSYSKRVFSESWPKFWYKKKQSIYLFCRKGRQNDISSYISIAFSYCYCCSESHGSMRLQLIQTHFSMFKNNNKNKPKMIGSVVMWFHSFIPNATQTRHRMHVSTLLHPATTKPHAIHNERNKSTLQSLSLSSSSLSQ